MDFYIAVVGVTALQLDFYISNNSIDVCLYKWFYIHVSTTDELVTNRCLKLQ